jgi:hypothetical protein
MADEWDQFSDAPHDEWGEFADAPKGGKRKTSQTLGLMKGIARPIQNFQNVNPLNALDTPIARGVREGARQNMLSYFADREETQRPGMVGEIAGGIVGTLPVLAATRNPLIAGGAQGALMSEADSTGGVAADVVGGAALGYAGGKVVGAISDAISPIVAPAAQRLRDAGVRLTPGMVKGGKAMAREDKAMSRPVVGEAIVAGRQKTQETFNTAAVNRALSPLGKKVPSPVKPGHDAIEYAKTEIGRAYDTVIPHLSVKINGGQFAANVMPVAQNLKPAQQKHLAQIVSNELGAGQLSGDALKRAQSNLRRLAGKFSRSQDANDQLLGEALGAVDDELTSAMIAQNPKYAPQLQKVNEAYRGYRIVADAAGRADDGLFNTGQLKQSVRRGDFSKSKDATARGKAFMQDFSEDARAVIPARTPDSGTAGRLNDGNMFARLGGTANALAYRADDAYQQFRLAPRPAGAKRVADRVRRLRGPASALAIGASSQSRD